MRNSECEVRNEGNFCFCKNLYSTKRFSWQRKSSIISNFELHISNLLYYKIIKKLPIHKGTRRLAVPPLFKANALHSFALTQHHVLLNTYSFSQKAPVLKFKSAPYKGAYSR